MIVNKKIINVTFFSIIFCLFFSSITQILIPKWKNKDNDASRTLSFYEQPKNSIDVLFIGGSSFRDGFAPLVIWREYGYTSYNRATRSQTPMVSYYYLVESLKYQHPKVVVINNYSLFLDFLVDKREAFIRTSVDPLRISSIKIKLILDIISKSKFQTFISYLFPLFRYHSRWKHLSQEDFEYYKIDKYDPFKGHYVTFNSVPYQLPDNYMFPTEKLKYFPESSLYYHEKIIQLCKKNNIDIVYIALPKLKSSDYSQHLATEQLAKKYNLKYLNYGLPELINKVGINTLSDMHDQDHLNFFGAEKISRHFGAFLKNNFDLIDKRNDPAYEQWNIDLRYLNEFINQ